MADNREEHYQDETAETAELFEKLKKPFLPTETKYRYQTGWSDKESGKELCLALPYLESRDIMDRLDAVVGPGKWETKVKDPHVVVRKEKEHDKWVEKDVIEVTVILCLHTPEGVISREDCGHGDDRKSAVSDGIKRVGAQFGIGRYLYQIPKVVCERKKDSRGNWMLVRKSAIEVMRENLEKHYKPKYKDAEAETKAHKGELNGSRELHKKEKAKTGLTDKEIEVRNDRFASIRELMLDHLELGVPRDKLTPAYAYNYLRKRNPDFIKGNLNDLLLDDAKFSKVLDLLEEIIGEKGKEQGRAPEDESQGPPWGDEAGDDDGVPF